MFCGWVFTLAVGGIISAVLFAWGTFAPNKAYGTQILQYQRGIQDAVNAQLTPLNAAAGANPADELAGLNSGWQKLVTPSKDHPWPSTTTPPADVLKYLNGTT